MELTNDFTVPVPIDRAWEVLNDVELIAPCLPGAQLQEIEGDEHRGIVKVKVGPITAQYKGAAVFTERDRDAGRIVIKAEGRDTRGQGSASALITVTMVETDGSTHVDVNSDVTIKGKVAQFGRGMIADVSAKLLTQFVECLEGKLEAEPEVEPAAATPAETPGDDAAEAAKAQAEVAAATTAASSAGDADAPATVGDPAAEAAKAQAAPEAPKVRKIDSPEVEPLDLAGTAGDAVAKRIVPVVVVVLLLLLIGRRRSKRA